MSFTAIPSTLDEAVAALRQHLGGVAHTPADDGYAAARRGWNVAIEQHPAVVVEAADAGDVAHAVRFARAMGARVAVQATGHGIGRAADGAVLITTGRLGEVTIDPQARTARVAAGAKWGAVLNAAQMHGLAPLLGSSTDVGAVGYTLGGGFGWLARRYGLASDSVRSFDLVTPDGIEVRTSADEQTELFWALKGGGAGSLGIVTAMEIELYPVTTVYAGNLLYPVEMAAEVIARWRDWVADVPDELTSAVAVMNFPPFEEVPEPVRGRSFVIVRGCWIGDLAAGAALVDQWRAWRAPELDLFGPMPFSEADTISNDPVDATPHTGGTEWFDDLADEAIDIIVEATVPAGRPPALVFSEIRHAGGAVRAGAAAAANDRGRSGEFLMYMLAVTPDADAALTAEALVRHTRHRLSPYATGASYLNFLDGEARAARSATAFSPEHRRRLAVVKQAVDAEDRFCHGYAIAGGPAGS
jgi:hypothetical protein